MRLTEKEIKEIKELWDRKVTGIFRRGREEVAEANRVMKQQLDSLAKKPNVDISRHLKF